MEITEANCRPYGTICRRDEFGEELGPSFIKSRMYSQRLREQVHRRGRKVIIIIIIIYNFPEIQSSNLSNL